MCRFIGRSRACELRRASLTLCHVVSLETIKQALMCYKVGVVNRRFLANLIVQRLDNTAQAAPLVGLIVEGKLQRHPGSPASAALIGPAHRQGVRRLPDGLCGLSVLLSAHETQQLVERRA